MRLTVHSDYALRALDAFLSELDDWMLADIVSNRKSLLDELQSFQS